MLEVINLKDVLVEASLELLQMFGLDPKYICELCESSLNSGEEVNVQLGLTVGLKGNIVLCLTKPAALKLASGMMCGMEVTEFDEVVKSALCEFMNMLGGNALGKLKTADLIDISPPSIIIGQDTYLMISRAPSKKLFFKLGETKFNISYCIEQ